MSQFVCNLTPAATFGCSITQEHGLQGPVESADVVDEAGELLPHVELMHDEHCFTVVNLTNDPIRACVRLRVQQSVISVPEPTPKTPVKRWAGRRSK